MQLEWIICVALVLVSSQTSRANCTTNSSNSSSSASDQLRRDIERLWAPALQAINEAELQRLGNRPHASGSSLPQRTNSKRMRWRLNSKLLARRAERKMQHVEPRSVTYLSSGPEENSPNPSYIDVKDYEPQPAAWWF